MYVLLRDTIPNVRVPVNSIKTNLTKCALTRGFYKEYVL